MVAWLLGWLAGWYVFGRAVHLRLVYGFVWVDSLARGKNELDAPNINLKTPVIKPQTILTPTQASQAQISSRQHGARGLDVSVEVILGYWFTRENQPWEEIK